MPKTQKLKIFALLFLAGGFIWLGQAPASAASSPAPSKTLINYCAKKYKVSSNSKYTAACAYGYTLGLGNKNDSGCSKYKKDAKALRICKAEVPNGKQDTQNINGQSNPSNPNAGGQPGHCDSNNCDLIALYVNPAIRILSIVVGLVVAASLILGGIQYTAASGDPQKISAAKSRITNTLLALIAFAFLYAFLNFLVPGGIF
jgi:hypothetical protein